MSSMARRHSLMLFFALAHAFSWVAWAPAVLLLLSEVSVALGYTYRVCFFGVVDD